MTQGSVAYILNQYPKVSHSFIRTEIHGLESRGIHVQRYAMRGWDAELVDPLDRQEQALTRYVLRGGAWPLIGALLSCLMTGPRGFARAAVAALQMARGGERGLLVHAIYLAEACVLRRWLRVDGARHVHAHFGSNAATVALLMHRLGGPPFSFTVHGPEEFDKPLQLKLGHKVREAKAVVAITSFCRSQLYRWSDEADWPKITVVGCALDDRFATGPAQPIQDHGPPQLVCVGRLCEQKGQLLLLQALADVRERGRDVRLTLAGDGEMRGSLERAIDELGLGDRVTITGWVDAATVGALLGRSRALVLPSFAEGLPIVLMEAMARARPVVTTVIAGVPELIRDGVEGFLVPAGDCDALVEALLKVTDAPVADLDAMGTRGAARVRERHLSGPQGERLARLFGQH